jgi:hypothetical protein
MHAVASPFSASPCSAHPLAASGLCIHQHEVRHQLGPPGSQGCQTSPRAATTSPRQSCCTQGLEHPDPPACARDLCCSQTSCVSLQCRKVSPSDKRSKPSALLLHRLIPPSGCPGSIISRAASSSKSVTTISLRWAPPRGSPPEFGELPFGRPHAPHYPAHHARTQLPPEPLRRKQQLAR